MYTLLPIRIFMIFELAFFSLACQEFLDDIAPHLFLKQCYVPQSSVWIYTKTVVCISSMKSTYVQIRLVLTVKLLT